MEQLYMPSFKLDNARWEDFKQFVAGNYPKDSFSHEQKDFVHKALLSGPNKTCPDENRLWVNVFCDHLCTAVGESGWPTEETSLVQKTEFLNVATSKAILSFFNSQNALRQSVHHDLRSPEEVRMLQIHPNIINFPLSLSLDMGRILQPPLKAQTAEEISSTSETVEREQLFHTLHRQILHQLAVANKSEAGEGGAPSASVVESEVASQLEAETMQEEAHDWSGKSAEDRFLRLCCFKVWSHKYEQEEEWSPSNMSNGWLKEAIELYNHVSYHWPQCHIKKFPTDGPIYQGIRQAAIKNWIPHVSSSGIAPIVGASKPTSPWITDWSVHPYAEKRRQWENFYCSVMLRAKNIAKLLHKRDVAHMEPEAAAATTGAAPSAEAPKRKRAKRGEKEMEKTAAGTEEIEEGAPQFDPKSLEYKIQQIVRYECGKLEQKMRQLHHDGEDNHTNMLQEMAGHFSPVVMQLNQLSRGQGFLYNMIDNLGKK